MSVLNRKLRRELWSSRGTLAAILGIIVLGICCFVAMGSAYFNLESARRSYYAQCRMADFSVDFKKVSLAELERLQTIEGIAQYRTRISSEVSVDLPGEPRPLSARVISMPASPAPVINDILIQHGGYFSDGRASEVIINDAFARARNIRPGDRLAVILNNRRQSLTVVGTAMSSEFVYLLGPGSLVPDNRNYAVFYLPREFAEDAFDMQGACNQVVGLLSPADREHPQRVLREIELRFEPQGVIRTTPRSEQPSHLFLSSEIEGLRTTVIFLPGVFLAVAALILNVLMTRVAEQQRTIVGTLKSLGYSNRQLLLHYLKFGGTIGVIGGLLGAIAGWILAGGMTAMYAQFYEFPSLPNRPHPAVIAIGAVVALVFAVGGTLRGILTIMRLNPAEAMRPKPPQQGRRIMLEAAPWVWSRLGFRWQMILRGVFRNRMRTLAGLFAAAVGAALVLVGLYSRDGMNQMMDHQFDKLLLSDYDLALKDQTDYGAVYEAQRLPGVDLAEPLFEVACTLHHGHRRKQGGITGVLPQARLTVPRTTSDQRVAIPEVGVVLSRSLANQLEAVPGDVLTMVPVLGSREPVPLPVTSVVDSYLGMAAYADFHYLNRLMGEEASVTTVQLKVRPEPDSIAAFYREVKELPAVQTVAAIREQKQQLRELFVQSILASIIVVIGFAGLIFFCSILNSSLISLAERQQEIATLRVLGYSTGEVGMIFFRESLLVHGLGAVFGLPLGYWLCLQTQKMMDTDVFRMPLIIEPWSWVWPVILGVFFTVLAHLPVQSAIRRLDVREALNVKE